MSGVNVYGKIITLKSVRTAVENNVRKWSPDYLAEVAENDGRERDDLPLFRSYFPVANFDKLEVENQLPACVIVAPGTMSGNVVKRVKGIDARFAIGLGAVVSAMDEDSTYELAELYCAALRSLMVQHPSCDGFATGFTFLSETIEILDANAGRTLVAGIVQGGLDVTGIVDPAYGPVEPSDDRTIEPPDWPEIETVESTITATGVNA